MASGPRCVCKQVDSNMDNLAEFKRFPNNNVVLVSNDYFLEINLISSIKPFFTLKYSDFTEMVFHVKKWSFTLKNRPITLNHAESRMNHAPNQASSVHFNPEMMCFELLCRNRIFCFKRIRFDPESQLSIPKHEFKMWHATPYELLNWMGC